MEYIPEMIYPLLSTYTFRTDLLGKSSVQLVLLDLSMTQNGWAV